MSQGNLKKNYVYQLLYQFVRYGTPIFTTPYIARVLGAEGVGIYSFTSSILAYFSMFAALGTSIYGARTIAQCRDDRNEMTKNFWEIEILTIFTSSISIAAWLIWSFVSNDFQLYFFALTPHLFANMFNIVWFYKGLERVGYVVRRDIFFKILGICYLFLFVKTKDDLFSYMFVNALISLIGSLSMWIYLHRILVKINIRSLSFLHHMKETIVYFIPTIAVSIYTILDKTLIGVITQDVRQNGYYEQANKIIKMVKSTVIISVNSVITVRSSYLFASGKNDKVKEMMDHSLNYIMFLSIGAMFGLCGIAKNFVPVFLGEGYDSVVILLCCMAPLIVLVGISNTMGAQYYTPIGKRRESTKYIIYGSCFNLLANLLLIPKYGAVGAVVATLFAESIISFLYVKNSCGYMSFKRLIDLMWKKVLAGGVILSVIASIRYYWTGNQILLLFVQIISGAAIYGMLLLLLKDAIAHEIWNNIVKFIKRVRNRLR